MVTDTLAWALFANGLDEEALTNSKAALAAASEAKQAEYSGYVTKLEAAIAAASGEDGQTALEALTKQVAELDAEVSARTSWRFEDDADELSTLDAATARRRHRSVRTERGPFGSAAPRPGP